MFRSFILTTLTIGLMISLPLADCFGRGGRGGGGFGGGASHGGGFSGGASRGGFSGGGASRANFGGGGASRANFGGGDFGGARGGADRSPMSGRMGEGGFGGAGENRGNFGGGNFGAGGAGRNPAAGRAGEGGFGGAGRGPGGAGADSNRFSTPSKNSLDSFLGMPSDGGMHGLGNNTVNNFNRNTDVNVNRNVNASDRANLGNAGDNVDVSRGSVEGPRGGVAAGGSVTGPRGNTAYRGGAVGANGGAVAGRGVEGADGGRAAQGVARGPGGRVAAGGAVEGRNGAGAARGVVAGPRGAAAGFTRVTPSGRYNTAVAVRGNYHNWGIYNRGWYANYPGAWFAAGWAANTIWRPCTWATAATYVGYAEAQPIYYDYGTNITYSDNNVYFNGEEVGTAEEYYDQAASVAADGAKAEAPADGDWMPLGVFALSRTDSTESEVTIQLAVNKEGIIRGNSTDTATKKNQVIQGSVDKTTQMVAFTVGDHPENVVETGLYNLTKDESPVLIHFGKDRTEQWLLVRLENKEADSSTSAQ